MVVSADHLGCSPPFEEISGVRLGSAEDCQMTLLDYIGVLSAVRAYRLDMRSDRIELSRSVKLLVRRYFWYVDSSSDHGGVIKKNSFSWVRASFQEIPWVNAFEFGCLTQYQLFSNGSTSFLIKRSHRSSSPGGMRSGLVSTPEDLGGQISVRLSAQ